MKSLLVMLSLFISMFQVTATALTKNDLDTNVIAREDTIRGLNYLTLWARKSIETKRLENLIKSYKEKNYSRIQNILLKNFEKNNINFAKSDFDHYKLIIFPYCRFRIDTNMWLNDTSFYNCISLDTNMEDIFSYVLIYDSTRKSFFPKCVLINTLDQTEEVTYRNDCSIYHQFLSMKNCQFFFTNGMLIKERMYPLGENYIDWFFIYNNNIFSAAHFFYKRNADCEFADYVIGKSECYNNYELDFFIKQYSSIERLIKRYSK